MSTQPATQDREEQPPSKKSRKEADETVVGPKEMQFWRELETKGQITEAIMERFKKHKSKDYLEKMGKEKPLEYVNGRLEAEQKPKTIGRRNRMTTAVPAY